MNKNRDKWVGNTDRQIDVITPALVERYKAVIGDVGIDNSIPFGLHWCLGLPKAPMDSLGVDGHPSTGVFLPPSPLPRRMWASSDVEFLAPLKERAEIERVSTVKEIIEKDGRSGKLLFVQVEHETMSGGLCCVRERQTIVYREGATKSQVLPKPQDHDLSEWDVSETVIPSAPLLFRYSALTFNTHRIHYDLPYALDYERYPALVVHGPLMASLLLRFVMPLTEGRDLLGFKFRGLAPAFCDQPLTMVAKAKSEGFELGMIGCDGSMVMSAEAKLG